MKTRAAVAFEAKRPLEIVEVDLEGPRAGEVLVEIKATGICHTDEFTLSGSDPEGLFPAILGHEGAGVVVDVGAGVTSLKKGDHVIPLYTPECRQCEYCLSGKTNLCQAIRTTQGQGVMPDGTSRFSIGGKPIHHYMGCSTFSNFTVLPEIAVAKIREDAPFDKVCYIGCGVTTGIGAVINTAKVEPGANVVVFGLGGIGLNVVQGARMAGADMIVGFPTETEEMFQQSCALIEDCGVTYVHAFPFSPRPGTPAARMPQVARETVKERGTRLRALGDASLARHLEGRVGKTLRLLTEKGGTARASVVGSGWVPPWRQRVSRFMVGG